MSDQSDRNILDSLNRTELVELARSCGLGNIGRAYSRSLLAEMLVEGEYVDPDKLQRWRTAMERHIKKNKNRLRSQLPGCNGQCTTYGCPDLIVTRCWDGFKDDMV